MGGRHVRADAAPVLVHAADAAFFFSICSCITRLMHGIRCSTAGLCALLFLLGCGMAPALSLPAPAAIWRQFFVSSLLSCAAARFRHCDFGEKEERESTRQMRIHLNAIPGDGTDLIPILQTTKKTAHASSGCLPLGNSPVTVIELSAGTAHERKGRGFIALKPTVALLVTARTPAVGALFVCFTFDLSTAGRNEEGELGPIARVVSPLGWLAPQCPPSFSSFPRCADSRIPPASCGD